MPPGELTKNELADVANREHRLAIESGNSMVEHAICCGEALIKAKAKLKEKEGHGNWIEWLVENFEATKRTAQKYMLLASKTNRDSFLGEASIRKVLEAISKEKKDDIKKTAMADTLSSRAAEIHSDEDDPEFMFQDYEGIAAALISEASINDVVFEVAGKDDETIENFNAFVESMDSTDFQSFEDAFHGRYKSEVDYAESYAEECGILAEIPEHFRCYFDYEKFARDLFIDDVYFHNETGCVFSRNY